jgi:site-specific recombinase XerD
MPPSTRPVPLIPSLHVAVARFLDRGSFAARTRESYAADFAPLLAPGGEQPVPAALTPAAVTAYLATQEHFAAGTYNRRFAALHSLVRWCQSQGYLEEDPLAGLEHRPSTRQPPRALDPDQLEAVLRSIRDVRDRALFWLIYEGGLRCREALAIDIDDIDWTERCIPIQGKGARPREMFFSRRISGYLAAYLTARGTPTHGPLFVTARRARNPRHANLTPDGYARLSYRQADTLWKGYTPGWDLHGYCQLEPQPLQ